MVQGFAIIVMLSDKQLKEAGVPRRLIKIAAGA